jgi:hypothetical protein
MDPERTNMDEDELMASARLEPDKISFPEKDKLRKSAIDLTENQIEYLSIACLEKDISPDQLQELEINLKENSENQAIFDTVQKTKLVPPAVVFKNKNSLKRLSVGQKVFRIAWAGLSMAATIAILILSYLFVPDFFTGRNNQTAAGIIQNTTPGTIIITGSNPILALAKTIVPETRNGPKGTEVAIIPAVVPDTLPVSRIIENQFISSVIVPVVSDVSFRVPDLPLIASNNNYIAKEIDEERSRLRKFIASTFREKILGEKFYTDEAIRPIEVAMAGVNGMNKLFDWNMELRETLDEAGEVKSVYFSSALLTFNSPVKKTSELR